MSPFADPCPPEPTEAAGFFTYIIIILQPTTFFSDLSYPVPLRYLITCSVGRQIMYFKI